MKKMIEGEVCPILCFLRNRSIYQSNHNSPATFLKNPGQKSYPTVRLSRHIVHMEIIFSDH